MNKKDPSSSSSLILLKKIINIYLIILKEMSLTHLKKPKDIKIVVIGNCGTGKTSFCHKWIKDIFSGIYKATIMSEFSYKIHEYNGCLFKVQLWDLAGQDRNLNVTKILTKNTHGCLIFSDVTNDKSLKE